MPYDRQPLPCPLAPRIRPPRRGPHLLEELLRQDPDNPDLLYNLGLCYVDLGQLDKVMELLHRCLQLAPGYSHAYVALGVAYQKKGDIERAQMQFPDGTGDGGTRGPAWPGKEWAAGDRGPGAQGQRTADGCGLLLAGYPAALPQEVVGGDPGDLILDRDAWAARDGLDINDAKKTNVQRTMPGRVFAAVIGSLSSAPHDPTLDVSHAAFCQSRRSLNCSRSSGRRYLKYYKQYMDALL